MPLQSDTQLPNDVLKLLRELSVALTHHMIWSKIVHKALVCGTMPNQEDLTEDSHQKCQFGVWYHKTAHTLLKNSDLFDTIDELHIDLHHKASQLLKLRKDCKPITPEGYEDFIDTVQGFRMALQELQLKLVSNVCAVDQLTGVWNRYAMSQRLNQEHERVRRSHEHCVIAILDFDHFKDINDRLGHVAGDKVLKIAMNHLSHQVRQYDAIFRYGGEEFLFLLPDTDIDEATEILERLRQNIKELPIEIDGETIHITVSIGVTTMEADINIHETIERADNALLNAKVSGRDCVHVLTG